jgi:hypothetical protein
MEENKKLNIVWMANAQTILEVIELAKANGKKAGESMEAEVIEIWKKYKDQPEKIQILGLTEQDKDMLLGNLREEGLKILDLDEEARRKKNDKENSQEG